MNIKYKIWTYPGDCGDGSVAVFSFPTRADAEKFAEKWEEDQGYGWGESCISEKTLEFDSAGVLVNGDNNEE